MVFRPNEGMRAAMAAAEVGDDVFRDDPTVLELGEQYNSTVQYSTVLRPRSVLQRREWPPSPARRPHCS